MSADAASTAMQLHQPDAAELAVALLHDLVSIASPTGDTDAAAEALVAWGRKEGLHAGRLPTGAPWLSTAEDPLAADPARPHVLLFGHIDTVPGEIPVRIQETDGGPVLWGRGSVDAKGPLAVFAALAASMHSEDSFPGTLTVIGAVDEEGDSDTAFWTIGNWVGRPPDAIVIGEPSGVHAVTLGYKGRMLVDVVAEGEMVHGGHPTPAAGDRLVAALARLRDAVGAEDADPERGFFERITMKVRQLVVETDGLKETARARLDVRLPPNADPDEAGFAFQAAAGDVQVKTADQLRAHVTKRTSPLARAFVESVREEGVRPRLLRKTGTADLNILGPAWPQVPIVAYGPGDSRLDHTPDERVPLADVMAATRVLRRVLAGIGSG